MRGPRPLPAACRDGAASRTPPALPVGPRQWPKAFRPSAVAGLLAVAAVTGSDVGAQPLAPPKSATLDPVVVTASRGPQSVLDLLADVTVIGADDIARAGAQSLPELLQRQPGVEIVQNGGPASVSGVFLRGTNRGQVLVLIDGVRLASQSVGATSLEAIPLEQIERIEILRGPASSLYGADAIGGVIQVFTRRGTAGLTGSASAGYGTYGTWSAAAGVGGSAGPFRLSAQLGAKGSAGFDAIADPRNFAANDDRDGYAGNNASASATLPWAAGQELSAQYFYSRLDAQYDGGPGHDDRTITTLQSWQVASRNQLAESWVSRLSAGAGTDDSVSETGYGDFPFRTVQRQYAWQNDVALPRGALTLGLERREESVATDAEFAVTTRTTNAAFAIYQLRVAAHALQANLRVDDASQYGNHTTGAVAYGYTPAPGLRFTAAYGTAFKAPSFNDLYYPGFSNPSLVPETSRNAEAGAYWSGGGDVADGRWQLRAIAYRNRVDDLIVFQCDAAFNCAPQNADRATMQGVTLGADATIGTATVTASVDLQSPRNDTTDTLLPRRARQHGAITVAQQAGPLRVGAELVASSYRYDDAANLVRLAGYGILNLTAEWTLSPRWTVQVRANNVFDRDYELAAGYATGGATVFAALRWQP